MKQACSEYGFDAEVIHIREGALITMTIMSGSVQFSGAGAESVVAARIEGGDVVLLACPVDTDAVYLVARPEIKSAADLKGKTGAVTRLGSTTHLYLRTARNRFFGDKKTVEAYAPLFKPVPYVPDKGLDLVLKELPRRRPVPKEFMENPDQFRDHGPLEKLVRAGWIDQLYK